MIDKPTLVPNTWFLMHGGARKKFPYEEKTLNPGMSIFREHSPTDTAAWFTDGTYVTGDETLAVKMRDPNQYDAYGPLSATVDTPDKLVVTLLLRCEIDKHTNVITESILGGPGMDTEALVRYAYKINGKPDPDAEGLAWWVNEVNTGKWKSFVDCLLGISAVFNDRKQP